jgi:hypothetical protein
MQGVTTALVLFIFACVAFPKMVRSKPQFYVAVALTAGIILLDALRFMATNAGETTRPGGFGVFLYVIGALAQFLAFVALILGCGGLSMKELADDMAGAFDAVRKGDERPIKVPLTGQKPKPRDVDDDEEGGRVVYTIDSPEIAPTPTPRPGTPASGSIPLHDEDDLGAPTPPPTTTPPPPSARPEPPPAGHPPDRPIV